MVFSVDYSCTLPSSEGGEIVSVMTAYRETNRVLLSTGVIGLNAKEICNDIKVCISHLNNSASEVHLFTMNLLKL